MNGVKQLDFSHIKRAVANQWEAMQKHPLFRTSATGQELWDCYMSSFPLGTNEIYRERRAHDCSCCRNFIRDVGNVVTIVDGELVTVWDAPTGEPAYDAVCAALAAQVRSYPIAEPFLHGERVAGVDKNFEQLVDGAKTWEHFFVNIAPAYVVPRKEIATKLSEKRSAHDALLRALQEINLESIDQFLELVAQGSLYRGGEHKGVVRRFRELKVAFDEITDQQGEDLFVWLAAGNESGAIARIRNSVAGTLLSDLSEGKGLEAAVGAYEAKVAPTNYKRPTALVTTRMIEQAKATIEELGLTSALERRFAVISDISINNVLWADRKARKAINGDVFDDLIAGAQSRTPKTMDAVEEVPVERFINDVLPKAESIEVLMENKHVGNLVSLIAPVDATAGQLFKWPNKFSWSYAGELADSIKERVKQAGGNVTGDLCCRLSWHNHDDLDLHMVEPNGRRVYYGNRSGFDVSGQLDVDMNVSIPVRNPVENIFYRSHDQMQEGNYRLEVNQYNKRESSNTGFEVEIDWLGTIHSFSTETSPSTGQPVVVAEMTYTKKGGLVLKTPLKESKVSRQVWGLPTESYHRVTTVMHSPNFWDGKEIGNKHHLFMLDGCTNDGTARGFFNEFLTPELDKHRKVLEMVGSKVKPAPANEQLSGLGFSSTQKNSLVVRVKGSFTRTLKVTF